MGGRRMEMVTSIEEGLKKLLLMREMDIPKYSYGKMQSSIVDQLCYQGKEIPVFYWRHEPKIMGLRIYGQKNVQENCTLNAYSFAGKDETIEELLFREMDLAEYILGAKVVKVTAVRNGDACNIIGVTELGTCVNLEIGTTMAPGSTNQCQHRLITKRGMANDRVVDTQVVQESVYVYDNRSTTPTTYSDLDLYLYGLRTTDILKVSFAFSILTERQNVEELILQAKHLNQVVKAVQESVDNCTTVSIMPCEEVQDE